MMTAPTVEKVEKKRYTEADVWELSLQDKHYELIDGELIAMAPTKLRHGRVTGRIHTILSNFVDAHDLGEVYAAETGFTLPNGDVLASDVSFIRTERIPEDDDTSGFPKIAPDLVVEVISDSSSRMEMQQKIESFFAGGTRLFWVVYPRSQTIYRYESPDTVVILQKDAVLDGGDVLPGFSVRLSLIFKRSKKNSE